MAEAVQGSRAEGILIGKDGDVPVYKSQRQLVESILGAGVEYIGEAKKGSSYSGRTYILRQQRRNETNLNLGTCSYKHQGVRP